MSISKIQPDTDCVLTLIAASKACVLDTAIADKVTDAMGGCKPDWLSEQTACDIAFRSDVILESRAEKIRSIIANQPIDFAIQPIANRKKKVLIADMDSTMIDQECIDELAAMVGVKERVSAITARAMNGEIEFEPALRERVALLEGLPENIADEVIANHITLAKGGNTLLATLKKHGVHCALVSGGFTIFTARIANMLGFDEHHANTLEVAGGRLTGKVKEPILGAQAKVDALRRIAAVRKSNPQDFIAVGDGANDLPMLTLAGTGVALHAKPAVAAQSDIRIDHGDLTALLYLQGYRDVEISRHAR